MVMHYVHIGFPFPEIEDPLHRLFSGHPGVCHFNQSPHEAYPEVGQLLGKDFYCVRRHLYKRYELHAPIVVCLKQAIEQKPGCRAAGFSLPDFVIPEADEVDLLTRAHRLYDLMSFGTTVFLTIRNQFDFVRAHYLRKFNQGAFLGTLDAFIESIVGQPYYGLAIDLAYHDVYALLASIFGHQNVYLVVGEELLNFPVRIAAPLWQNSYLEEVYRLAGIPAMTEKEVQALSKDCFQPKPADCRLDLPFLTPHAEGILRRLFAPSNQALLRIRMTNNPDLQSQMYAHGYPF